MSTLHVMFVLLGDCYLVLVGADCLNLRFVGKVTARYHKPACMGCRCFLENKISALFIGASN